LNGHATQFTLQSLTSGEMRELRQWTAENDANRFRVWQALIARCVVDNSEQRIFQNSEVETGVFDDWDGALVEQLGMAIDSHVGYTEDVWSISELNDAAKN